MTFLAEWARLALAVFACYRLAGFIVYDEGPGSMFLKLRKWAGSYDLGQNGQPKRALGRFMICPYCLGVWFAIGCAAAVILPTMAGDIILTWLGIAGAQSYLEARKNVSE